MEDDLQATGVEDEQLTPLAGRDDKEHDNDIPDALVNSRVQAVDIHGDLRILHTESTHVEPDGRTRLTHQRHFYQFTDSGWVRVSPRSTDLGKRERRQNERLTYEYSVVDREAVATLAVDLDTVYARLRRDYGLPPLPQHLVVDVDISSSDVASGGSCFGAPRVCVASPVVIDLPDGVTEEQVLRLWVVNALVFSTFHEAMKNAPLRDPWQYATGALLRFQMRRHSDLAATWHEDLVVWLYSAEQETEPDDLAGSLASLCERHRILERRQVLDGIDRTYLCVKPPGRDLPQLARKGPPDRLDDLLFVGYEGLATDGNWFFVLAFETVLDYALATYGPDAVPELIAGFRQYNSWETLIPAVFDISPEEFERGWQAHLMRLR